MASRKRSGDTIAALLGNAPALAPVSDPDEPRRTQIAPEVAPKLQRGEQLYEATAEPVRPVRAVPDDDDLDEDDLENFEFTAEAPLVKRRRRKQVDYQTARLQKNTWRILRDTWLMARQVDPLLSFTEYTTQVVQAGLRALKEQRQRDI